MGEELQTFQISCKSFEGRIETDHRFSIAARDKSDAIQAVQNRWPHAFDVKAEVSDA